VIGDDGVVIADAGNGWRAQDAVVAARCSSAAIASTSAVPDTRECLYVRRLTTLPMVLDESIGDPPVLQRTTPAAWTRSTRISRSAA
jgi:hypothetical protein